MTVGELEQRISARELSEWMIYDELSPIGPERADWRAGMLASVVAMSAGGKKKYKPDDFMPEFKPRKQPKQNSQSMMMAFMAATGGANYGD